MSISKKNVPGKKSENFTKVPKVYGMKKPPLDSMTLRISITGSANFQSVGGILEFTTSDETVLPASSSLSSFKESVAHLMSRGDIMASELQNHISEGLEAMSKERSRVERGSY